MANEAYFSLSLASNDFFCNRVNEKAYLNRCVNENINLVISSPRRYGKTSLIYQALQEYHIIFTYIDFLPATDEAYVKNAILNGVSHLLSQLLEKHKNLKSKILQLFSHWNPKITLTILGQKIEFSPTSVDEKNIQTALLNLNQTMLAAKTKAAFVMDEFQQVGILSQNHHIEAAIRHAVERSKNITYIFSGSNRDLLSQMFNNKSRPLYHLCDHLALNRIEQLELSKFIQQKAQKRWRKKLDEAAVDLILNLTRCHTYYVNQLCRQLWNEKKIPDETLVAKTWQNYVINQTPWIKEDLGKLSPNQRQILAALAFKPTAAVQSQEFSSLVGLSPASIKRVIDTLYRNDYIYQDEGKLYRVVDPAVIHYLNGIDYFSFRRKI